MLFVITIYKDTIFLIENGELKMENYYFLILLTEK